MGLMGKFLIGKSGKMGWRVAAAPFQNDWINLEQPINQGGYFRTRQRHSPTTSITITFGSHFRLVKPPQTVTTQFQNPPNDLDGDGIPNASDSCPNEPEDADFFQDHDGCPEPDNDQDGILDSVDACPNEAEDQDGFMDSDGCPEFDNDADGFPDSRDSCLNEPETRNGIEDHDGCPDSDRDGDGIPDDKDACPDEPELRNFYQDEDGCPDSKPPLLRNGVLSECEFAPGADVGSGAECLSSLKKTAETLSAYPGTFIFIIGHTDATETENPVRLSQARAEWVLRRLVEFGMNPVRAEKIGKGDQESRASNRKAAGRSMNRRVELRKKGP
jgi:hypothetical protein